MQQGASCPPVSVGERVDGLELGMRESGLRENGDVVACDEGDQIVDGAWHPLVMGRHKFGAVGPMGATADPYLFLAPFASDLRTARTKESLVHRQDGLGVDPCGEVDRGSHRSGVGDDQSGVSASLGMKFRLGDGPGRGGQVLDLRGGGGLSSQQD